MAIKQEDISNALNELNLPRGEVQKGVPTDGDLNSSNGAADESGTLGVAGENMNDKHDNKKKKGEAKKSDEPASFEENLPVEVETKVEVSSFLKSLVDHTAQQVNGLRDFVVKSDRAQDSRFEEIMERLDDTSESIGNLGIVLKALCEKVGIIGDKPASSKSIEGISKSERTFENTLEEGAVEAPTTSEEGFYKSLAGKDSLTVKKAITDAMCDLVKKGNLSQEDVINFETFSFVTPEANKLLQAIL